MFVRCLFYVSSVKKKCTCWTLFLIYWCGPFPFDDLLGLQAVVLACPLLPSCLWCILLVLRLELTWWPLVKARLIAENNINCGKNLLATCEVVTVPDCPTDSIWSWQTTVRACPPVSSVIAHWCPSCQLLRSLSTSPSTWSEETHSDRTSWELAAASF